MQEKELIPNFLLTMLEKQYGEELRDDIIQGYQKRRRTTFRVNTIKTSVEQVKEILAKEQIEIEEVPWSKTAFVLRNDKEKQLRSLDIYENGEIYFQSLSSMLPPILLEPKPKENILDMAAAPGGKTTQIAAISDNQAFITACEQNAIRAERLKYNIEKQGAKGVYVMLTDSRKLNDLFSFDKILLDAPCSGSGTIQLGKKDWQKYFTEELIQKSCKTQLALLKKAIRLLKPGKELVYSTCSILDCENEDIVRKVLQTENVEIVPIQLESQQQIPMLPTKIAGTLCIAPNEYYEGFFVAKLRKNIK